MNDKGQIISKLTGVFNRWQDLIASLDEAQIIALQLPGRWSVKDVIAHLWTWQQISVARMDAAVNEMEPKYPQWWDTFGPDPEEDVDRTNAWIYETNRDKPWRAVYVNWKEQFQRYLELTSEIPEKDLLEVGRYTWMGKYALSASSMGSFEHHEQHLDTLLTWLRDHGQMKVGI
jgi:hypothetical protein